MSGEPSTLVFNWGVDELVADEDRSAFAYDDDVVSAGAASTPHLVVTPGDPITAEAGYLRYGRVVASGERGRDASLGAHHPSPASVCAIGAAGATARS